MENLLKSVSYIRVSTPGQVDGASLDTQERRCQEWALAHGVLNLRTFRDEGYSAKSTKRPALKEMLDFIAENHSEIKYLVLYDMDRLSRSHNDFVDIVKALAKYNIELKDPSSRLETTATDRFINNIKSLLAELDNEHKSQRVKENMQKHASDGYRMAKAPFGLRNTRDLTGRSTVEPISGTSEIIAYLLTEFSKGMYTIKELIALADEHGLKRANNTPMNHTFMGKMLRQPLYAGLEQSKHTKGELINSVFDGIVSKDVYYRNQELLKHHADSKIEGYKSIHEDYPLRRFVKCSVCASPVRGSASRGASGKTYPKYHCVTCKKASVAPEELHEQFTELLNAIKPNEATQKLMKKMIICVWNDELKAMRDERKAVQSRVDKLEDYKHQATEKLIKDVISRDEKIAEHAKADSQIASLRVTLSKIDSHVGTKSEAIDYAIDYMDNVASLWQTASPDTRAIYQAAVFPEGLTYNFYEKKFGTPKLSALYTLANMKKDLSEADKSLLVTPRRVELLLPG